MTTARIGKALATLNFSDTDDRRVLDWIENYFGLEKRDVLIDLARAQNQSQRPDVVFLVCARHTESGTVPLYAVLRFEIKACLVTRRSFHRYSDARDAFRQAVAATYESVTFSASKRNGRRRI